MKYHAMYNTIIRVTPTQYGTLHPKIGVCVHAKLSYIKLKKYFCSNWTRKRRKLNDYKSKTFLKC